MESLYFRSVIRFQLIADSGGTGTDWCLIGPQGREVFTTESYHPLNWSPEFIERTTKFWSKKLDVTQTELHFFGAGCLNDRVRKEAENLLRIIGFSSVHVLSDLHGAGIASMGRRPGWCAILGTGSVVFEWDGYDIVRYIGGLGHKVGDEGSGYYFGKLLLNAWRNDQLLSRQELVLKSQVDMSEFDDNLTPENEKRMVASLSKIVSVDNELFNDFHQKNVELFLRCHFSSFRPDKLHVVGSYGFSIREVLCTELDKYGIMPGKFVKRPIAALVEQMGHLNE